MYSHHHHQQQQHHCDRDTLIPLAAHPRGGDGMADSDNDDPSAHMRSAPLYTPTPIEMVIADTLFRWEPFAPTLFLPSDDAVRESFRRGDQLRPWTGVYLAVMATVPSRTSWWRTQQRRLEHLISGPWHHPELVFWREATRYEPSLCATISVYAERGVEISQVQGASSFDAHKNRSFWELVHLALTPEQAVRAFIFLLIQRGKPFNRLGYYCYYCAPQSWFVGAAKQNEPSWTCSQLVCQALIEADRTRYGNGVLDPRSTTPSELYHVIKRVGGESVVIDRPGY